MSNYPFFLLFPLHFVGYLLHSKWKPLIIFSTTMNILHILINVILMIGPLYIGFEYYKLNESDFWAYIGMAIHIWSCCTLLVCLGETLWRRKIHPIFLNKISVLNKSLAKSVVFQRKFNTIIWKYTIIIIVVLAFGSSVASIKYKHSPAQAFFYFYCITMMMTRNFQFNVSIDIIRAHLEMINLDLQMTLKEQKSKTYKFKVKETLLRTKETYEKLYDVSAMINQYRGLSALFISSLYSVLIVGLTYCRLVNFLKNIQIISNSGTFVLTCVRPTQNFILIFFFQNSS